MDGENGNRGTRDHRDKVRVEGVSNLSDRYISVSWIGCASLYFSMQPRTIARGDSVPETGRSNQIE